MNARMQFVKTVANEQELVVEQGIAVKEEGATFSIR